jgi:hypothetical protein
VLSGEAANTNFKVFGLTQPGLEPTIYSNRGERANHSTTDAVLQRGSRINMVEKPIANKVPAYFRIEWLVFNA